MTTTNKFAKTKDCQISCRDEVIPVGSLVEIRNNFMIYDGDDGMHPRPVDSSVIVGVIIDHTSHSGQGGKLVTYSIFTNNEFRKFISSAWEIRRIQ